MVARSKLYAQLDAHELELKNKLIPHLESAMKGENDLAFCVKTFNRFPEFKGKTDKVTEELIRVGAIVIALRSKLDEPAAACIAERICFYCREWREHKTNHLKSTRALARQFLAEIRLAGTN